MIFELQTEFMHCTHYAFVWFLLPILAGIGGGLAVSLIALLIGALTASTSLKGKSVGILGMPQAGKTRLLRILQGRSYNDYVQTATEDYDEFVAKVGANGEKEVKIQQGRDIGGTQEYIKEYYDKFIQEKDITFFLFDAKKYLENDKYANDVRARLAFMFRRLKEKYLNESELKARYTILATHTDCLSETQLKDLKNLLQSSVANKPYSLLFHNNLGAVDLTKTQEVKKYLGEEVFK